MDTFERGAVHPTAVVSADADVGEGVTVGPFAVIHPGVRVGGGSFVGAHCVLGEPTAAYYDGAEPAPAPCVIGDGAVLRTHSVVYQGVVTGAGLRLGHRVTLREGCVVGDDVQIGTMSDLQGNLTIGDHVRLHSSVFVAQTSVIEDFVWVFPGALLADDPHPPSDTCTKGPTVRRYAVVAARSVVMPGIEVGEHALVGAMALAVEDVPAERVVLGVPAKDVGSVHDVRCRHGAMEQVYPWPRQFRRGYPDGVLPDPGEFGAGPASCPVQRPQLSGCVRWSTCARSPPARRR